MYSSLLVEKQKFCNIIKVKYVRRGFIVRVYKKRSKLKRRIIYMGLMGYPGFVLRYFHQFPPKLQSFIPTICLSVFRPLPMSTLMTFLCFSLRRQFKLRATSCRIVLILFHSLEKILQIYVEG